MQRVNHQPLFGWWFFYPNLIPLIKRPKGRFFHTHPAPGLSTPTKPSTDNRNVFEQVFGEIKYLCRAATAGSQEARKLEKVKKAFGEAYRAETKSTVIEDGVKYSLMAFEQDGRRFVDVQMDANTFDGMTVAEMNRAAKAILTEKFAGKVIGIDNRAFVNGDSINEYLHPSKAIDIDTRKAKLTASGELDNLLDAGEALPNEPDGKDGHIHPDAIDFSYYKTVFKVGNEYFEGIVNIKNIKRGKLLKDITKIRNITKDIVSSYGENPKSNFLRDASMNSIRNSDGVVNTKRSQTDITDEIAKDMTKQIAPIGSYVKYSLSDMDDIGSVNEAISRSAANINDPGPEQTDSNDYLKVLEQLHAEIAMEEEIRKYNEAIAERERRNNERAALEWLELEREIARVREEFEKAYVKSAANTESSSFLKNLPDGMLPLSPMEAKEQTLTEDTKRIEKNIFGIVGADLIIPQKNSTIKISSKCIEFDVGEDVNNFFFYDDEKRGLLVKKKSQYSKWKAWLSEESREALFAYTADGYIDINKYLRRVKDWKDINAELVEGQIRVIDEAIKAFNLKESIVVQRGAPHSSLDVLFETYDIADLRDLIGKKYRDDAYMSTTALYGNPVATTKNVVFDISIPAGTGRGIYINEFSAQYNDAEYEFLIKRGATFTIMDISEDVGLDKVYVKMVMDVD